MSDTCKGNFLNENVLNLIKRDDRNRGLIDDMSTIVWGNVLVPSGSKRLPQILLRNYATMSWQMYQTSYLKLTDRNEVICSIFLPLAHEITRMLTYGLTRLQRDNACIRRANYMLLIGMI